jgi:lipopolysaccharide transport system permease protein
LPKICPPPRKLRRNSKVIEKFQSVYAELHPSRGNPQEVRPGDSIHRNISEKLMPASALEVNVYTSESPLRHPGRFIHEMFRDLRASRELAWRLFVRDTSAHYRQSMLGYLWALFPPLVASLPFVFLKSQGVVAIEGTAIPYPAYALIGTIMWQVFGDALNSPLKTVTAAKSMLVRIKLPGEAILLSGLGQVIFSFLIRMVLLVVVFAWFRIVPPVTVLLFPVGVLALILVGLALGVALTPLGLLYNDVQQTLPIATMFLMLLTPVVYPPPRTGVAATVASWNPLSPLILVTRDWLTIGHSTQIEAFALVTGIAGVLLFGGWIIYRVALPHIIARVGN